jgi:hypothetical protein
MSDIIDFNQFKSDKEWREFANRQTATILALQNQIKFLEEKLTESEKLLKNTTQVSPLTVNSNEEELCKIEIKRLYDKAKMQPLEWNEVRSFEVYVKALIAIKNKTPEEVSKKSDKAPKMNQAQLLELALKATDESTEQ